MASAYVASRSEADGCSPTIAKVVQADWLSESDCAEQFDVGYDYTYAPSYLPCHKIFGCNDYNKLNFVFIQRVIIIWGQ